MAEYCLGAIAVAEDSVRKVGEAQFRKSLKTDSMSISTYSALALITFFRSDTAGTIGTWQQVIRVEPGNQQLRDQAFDLFQRFGRQDAAEEVADEGIRLDPQGGCCPSPRNERDESNRILSTISAMAKMITIAMTFGVI